MCLALQDSPAALTKALRWTYITGGTLTLVMLILWPILALPAGVFSQGYFTMWIVVRLGRLLRCPELCSTSGTAALPVPGQGLAAAAQLQLEC